MRKDIGMMVATAALVLIGAYLLKRNGAPASAAGGAGVSGSPDNTWSSIAANSSGEKVMDYGNGVKVVREPTGAIARWNGDGTVSYYQPDGTFIGTWEQA